MTYRSVAARPKEKASCATPALPGTFLACYEILNRDELRWDVRSYKARPVNGATKSHEDRGGAKQVIWDLRKKHKSLCRGLGFVVDVDEETVIVPADWQLPECVREGEYDVTFERTFVTDPDDRRHRAVIAGILREGIKFRFKNEHCDALGDLWQDYDRFCQLPKYQNGDEYHFCRKFGMAAKALTDGRWVLQPLVSTATVDARTFADYFRAGEVDSLSAMVEAKQANRLNRRNRPAAVRALRDASTEHQINVTVLELEEPNLLSGIATLSRHEQSEKAGGTIRCSSFKKPPIEVPLDQLRLILDSQITQVDHSETILEPEDRHHLNSLVRDFFHGAEIGGVEIRLADSPLDASTISGEIVNCPSLRVRDEGERERIIASPGELTVEALRTRGRARADALKRFGFLQGRPINPLLAWPKRFGRDRAVRMASDLNYLMEQAGIAYQFGWTLYDSVEELNRYIQKNNHDALLAVLPEGWRRPHADDSMHEKIKKRVDVPSQCIQHDHTLPVAWVSRPHRDMVAQDRKLARRIQQRYELCIWNLLAKLHWIPFAPCDAFNYNVHIGLDVGGRHNNRVMACLGYGFASPRNGLLFRPEEISIDVQKAEPIPTEYLSCGLLQLIEQVHEDLRSSGVTPDWERLLVFRDGRLLGDGDEWNELDALRTVYNELVKRKWVSEDAVWTAVEIMKSAEGWRIMSGGDGVSNPIVGQCLFPFDDEATALLCTTGAPYLSQGTAAPLKVSIIDIVGESDRREVIRDIVWESDMCFTKPDIGMSLPWSLHVADAGALQVARSYKITGITL